MTPSIRLAGLAFAIVAAAVPAPAQHKPAAAHRVLPDVDIRDSLAAPPAIPGREVAGRLPAARGGDVIARHDPATGAVRTLFARGATLTAPQPGAARSLAYGFLLAQADLFGLARSEVRDLRFVREYATAATGVRHVFWTQEVDGIPVFDSVVAVHVSRDGAVLRVNSNAVHAGERASTAAVGRADAVRRAAADIRPEGGPFARALDASLTWFPVGGRLRLAWHAVVEPEGFPQAYDVLIDAVSGERLLRRNRVKYADATGRVLQSAAPADARRPDPRPFGVDGTAAACPPVSNHAMRSLNAPYRDPATVLGTSGRLAGNNAHVYRRAAGAEGASGTFDGTSWQFDFAFNTAEAAETALFFTTNFVHDFFYDLGFDEAAGNFQVDNFGRGGSGADPVRALARAGGRNNATWANAADGQSPTMSMFLWDGTGCWAEDVDGDGSLDLDGDLDSDIVIHEYHHGVTLRLNTAFTGPEAGAIGEGGGDFFAYSVNDDTQLAEYSYAGGLRAVNGRTYADWTCLLGIFCEVHDNGEIWANVLWDVRERFRRDEVRGSAANGIDESHRVYIDGLKLSPPSPSMLDLRDAMLQADAIRSPDAGRSANFCRLWESFAARGMGVDAVDSSASPLRTVVADATVPDGCAAPPPPASVTIAAVAATAYEAGPVAGAVQISRTGQTTLPLIVTLGRGGSASAADYLPLPANVTIPEGAASVTVPVIPIDDALWEANEAVNVTVVAGRGYVPASPSTATVTIVSDDVAPDLQVSALSAPAAAAAGGTIAIADTTANTGSGDAPETRTVFYLSANYSIDASDVAIAARTVPALAAGTSSQQTTTAQIPPGTAGGTYYLLAKADADDAAPETSEYNNTRSATVRVGPDLLVTTLTGPPFAAAGGQMSISDTTANQGGGECGGSTTRFYLSQNFSWDAADLLLDGARTVPPLAAGSASAGTTVVTIPAGTATATYYVIARADADAVVAEALETNNTRWMQVQIGADLVVSALSAPPMGAAGDTIAVTETTKNQGAGASGASTTAFYLSANSALDASDVRLGPGRAVPGLAAGATSTATTMVTLPATVSVGHWVLIARADADAAAAETQETNNTRFVGIKIGPDLSIGSLAAPYGVAAGSTMTVSDTVTNRGASAAGATRVRYYFSTNTLLDAGDTPAIEARDVPPLAGGGVSQGSVALTVPGGLAPGSYYLIAVADGDGAVAEVVETNNTTLRLVKVS